MKRREFSIFATAAALSLPAATPAWAQTAYKEGKNYLKLNKPAPTEAAAGRVEVVEFFGYFCPHCNSFEPTLSAWTQKAPKNLAIRRVPVAFNASLQVQQKLYYTLEGLGLVNSLHAKAFHAVHVERNPFNKDEQVFEWAAKQGLDIAKFKTMYQSFGVANQIRKASQLADAYQVEGVPSMGVAGRYYIDGGMAGSMPGMLQIVEYLAKQPA